jgi:pyridoxal phosphate enzyme (YggS family)
VTDANQTIAENIDAVRARIAGACGRADRDPADVMLIGVTKTHSADVIASAYDAGLRDFGENRVQEAGPKVDVLRARGLSPTWHLVGHLQRNKVAAALRLFDVIHSIDSLRLAEVINERSTVAMRVLIEVNVAGEASKQGVSAGDALRLAEQVGRLRHLALIGLMTVAPIASDAEDVRPVFRRLREIGDAAGLRELSMGMTDDFEVAVEEGATFVRVGRAIFGRRA